MLSDFIFRFSDYDFNELETTDSGRKICTRCDHSVLNNKTGRDKLKQHFNWFHVHPAQGVCYFCGVLQKGLRLDFENHVSVCLRSLNQNEIRGWLTTIIG
jgi:hypothetical protein